MDSGKFKDPAFFAALAACIVSLFGIALRPASSPDPDPRAAELQQLRVDVGDLQSLVTRLADEMKRIRTLASAETQAKAAQQAEFDEALSRASELLNNGEFTSAYDFLLLASRISATDHRLFEAVVAFIGKAKDSQDDQVVALAEDLLDRGDSLVHFQNSKDLEASRKRIADLRAAFPAPPKTPEPEPRSEPIRRLIELASNKDHPVEVRSKAAERARIALDEAWIDSSTYSNESSNDLTPEKIKAFQKQAEDAEKSCVIKLFESQQADAEKWLEETRKLIDEKENASQKTSALIGEIDKVVSRGVDLLQQVVPYAKSSVKGAQELSSQIEQRVGFLQRWKIWLYNREALDKIRAADRKGTPVETGLVSMATIDESLLAPYMAEKYNEVWKKLFDGLDENKKVEMTRRRVLRTIQ